jgi:uncharacterized protein YecT (DUF1311 family)
MKQTILVTMILFSGLAFADAKSDLAKVDADYQTCLNSPDGMSNSGMKGCTATAYDGADQILNKVYGNIVKGLKVVTGDKYSDHQSVETLSRLVTAQRAWITFRNADSELAGVDMLGGTGESLEIVSSLYDMTRTRAQALADLLGSY